MRRLAAVAVIATSVVASTWSEAAVPPAADPGAWSGVTELVTADIDASGAVSGTPSQQTLVTATGTSTVEIAVPMSSSGLERVDPGEPPDVVDGSAQFTFDLDGTESQTVESDFERPLPVTITPSYELDGEPTTPDELESSLVRSEGRAQRADGLVRDRERDEPDDHGHVHGRRRCRANGGGHAAGAACGPALAHVPDGTRRGSTRRALRLRPARQVSEPGGRSHSRPRSRQPPRRSRTRSTCARPRSPPPRSRWP